MSPLQKQGSKNWIPASFSVVATTKDEFAGMTLKIESDEKQRTVKYLRADG